MKTSLKSKLLIGGILASMLPLAVTGYFSVTKSTNTLVNSAESESVQIANDLAALSEEVIKQEKAFALAMAQVPIIKESPVWAALFCQRAVDFPFLLLLHQ